MSHGHLRQEKNCLNCGHTVEERFCPHCGQENIENRQPFHYLFTHFFEDFTHYDGQFWKTMKYLLFFPGKLTKIYLSGKRQLYVPPVKLYIFISFVTFFIVSFLGIGGHSGEDQHMNTLDSLKLPTYDQTVLEKALNNSSISTEDSIEIQEALSLIKNSKDSNSIGTNGNNSRTYIMDSNSLEEYDSISNKNPSILRKIIRPFVSKYYELKKNKVPLNEITKGFITVFMHTFPKALFFYLPFFAFILYIFHSKKKWWYYDHGVFTLHYFSFLLFVATFFLLLNLIEPSLNHYSWFRTISPILYGVAFIYASIYFFIAHHRFYATRKRSSIFLGIIIFFINSITFSILLLILTSISLLLIH